jgi:hypothetical protein
VEQVGRAVLHLKQRNEQYIIDYPDLIIRGVLTGSCYLELSGVCTISSNSGTKAVIEFVPKPWFGGEHNRIKGRLSFEGATYCTLSGKWSHQSFYKRDEESSKELLFDAEADPMAERQTAPIEEQKDIESHRLWGTVTEALKVKNYHAASIEKTKIEEWQRKIRKEREQKIIDDFKPVLFTFQEDENPSDSYAKVNISLLENMVGNPLIDKGAWTYNDSLYKNN